METFFFWGFLTDPRADTLPDHRCLGLAATEYTNLLHFFHSTACQVDQLAHGWTKIVTQHAPAVRFRGQPLYALDAIKVQKSGKRMPGVRLYHQQTNHTTKPSYIMGHFYGALTQIAQAHGQVFAVPLRFQLQDGLLRSPSEKTTPVDRMARLCTTLLQPGALIVADAYYTSKTMLKTLLKAGLHYIGRARITTVAYEPPPVCTKMRRGRPKKYGQKVRLRERFRHLSNFREAQVPLGSEPTRLWIHTADLYWQGLWVRFVLTITASGTERILLSTDCGLSAEEILQAYNHRFQMK